MANINIDSILAIGKCHPLGAMLCFNTGLAQPNRDGPFHHFAEAMLEFDEDGISLGRTEDDGIPRRFLLTGAGLIAMMGKMADRGRAEKKLYPPPPETDCHPPGCDFRNKMYRTLKSQGEGHYYSGHLSDKMAQHLINIHIRDTEMHRAALRSILETHGDLILSRWLKKSKEKRAAFLEEVSGLFHGKPMGFKADEQSQWIPNEFGGFSWAGRWLDVKDFVDDKMKLLSALHARAEYDPALWAPFDTRETFFAFESHLFDT